jgi:hypothetical protein
MFHIALSAFVSVLLVTDASAKKSKKDKSDIQLLVEVQNRWKTFWGKASTDVAVNRCKKNCPWQDLYNEEETLRTETVDLVMSHPEFEASVAEFMALSHRGSSPKEHGMKCQATRATTRDDYCICAQDVGVDWVLQCSLSKDKKNCHTFLHSMCGLVFHNDEQEEVIDDFEDLDDTEGRLREAHKTSIGEVQKEQPSKTEEQLLRLQDALGNLDKERQELFEVHAESKKGNRSVRPFLANIDRRIKRQKDKILRDMEEIINRREKEIVQEKDEADRGEEEYQKRLKALMDEGMEHEM